MASVQVREEVSTEICQYCGRDMVVRGGQVWQVPGLSRLSGVQEYQAAVAKIGVRCPRCGGEIVKAEAGKGLVFGCENYPDCEFRSWNNLLRKNVPSVSPFW